MLQEEGCSGRLNAVFLEQHVGLRKYFFYFNTRVPDMTLDLQLGVTKFHCLGS